MFKMLFTGFNLRFISFSHFTEIKKLIKHVVRFQYRTSFRFFFNLYSEALKMHNLVTLKCDQFIFSLRNYYL